MNRRIRTPGGPIAAATMLSAALIACETPTDLPPPPQPAKPGNISGQVVVSVPGSSTPQPAAGAHVQFLDTNLAANADANGRFFLSPVSETSGTLLIQAVPNAAGQFTQQLLLSLAGLGIGPGNDISLGAVQVGANASISGRVLLAAADAGVSDAGPSDAGPSDAGASDGGTSVAGAGTGLAGTTVIVPNGPFTAFTGDDGTFILNNLPPGQITLTFVRAGYASSTVGGITLTADQSLQLVNTVLTPLPPGAANTGTLAGLVVFAPPVTNASTTTATAVGSMGQTNVPIADDGTYEVTLAAGVYALEFSFPSYASSTLPNILVVAAATATAPTETLSPGAGEVDAGGMPPPLDGGPDDAGEQELDAPSAFIVTTGVVGVGGQLQLDGSDSVAAFAPPGVFLSYAWTQTAGNPVTFSINDSVLAGSPTITAPGTAQQLAVTLTVTDTRTGLTGQATTTIQVVEPPLAAISPPTQQVTAGATTTFNGASSTDPSGQTLTFAWSTISPEVVLGASTGSTVTVTAPALAGTYSIELVVKDPFLSSAPAVATLQVVAPTTPPTLTTGPDQLVEAGAEVHLTATAVAPLPVSFSWTQLQTGCATVALADSGTATPSFEAPYQSCELTFQVTATTMSDGGVAATVTATTSVTVSAPSVTASASPGASVAAGTTVTLAATAPELADGGGLNLMFDYQWTQISGSPTVTLETDLTKASFVAPNQAAVLGFQVVASTPTGSTSATVTVTVTEMAPLAITSSDPAVPATSSADAGPVTGPWLMAFARFNRPLDPDSVTSTTASITETTGATTTVVPATVEYIGASNQVRVVPLVPLSSGSYTFSIGAVHDSSDPPIVFAGQSIPFTPRSPDWTVRSSASVQPNPPNPGVAANDNGSFLFVSDGVSPCADAGTSHADAGPDAGTIVFSTVLTGDGQFNPAAACTAIPESSEPITKRGRNVGGTLYGLQQADSAQFANPAGTYVSQQVQQEWVSDPGPAPSTGAPATTYSLATFTDGASLYMLTGDGSPSATQGQGGDLNVFAWSAASAAWGADTALVEPLSATVFAGDGAGANGNLVVIVRTQGDTLTAYQLSETGTWELVPGPGSGGTVANVSAADPGTGFPRAASVAGAYFFAWSTSAGVDTIDGAFLTSMGTWLLETRLNDQGASANFDIEPRGNVVFLAYVVGQQLFLRQVDFTDPAMPQFTDVPGPGNDLPLNTSGCQPSHPEIANTDGTIYITWAEECAAGSWTVQLASLQ